MFARLKNAFRGGRTAMVTGGLFCLPIARLAEESSANILPKLIVVFLFGSVSGLVILGAIRLFRTSGWGHVIAGPLAGTLPVVVMVPVSTTQDDFGGLWLLSAILGLFIALLEWRRLSAECEQLSD